MKALATVICLLMLGACAGTYKPATKGPTITLKVRPEVKEGVPVISYSDMSIYLDQVGDRIEGTKYYETNSLGWQKIPTDGSGQPFILPADMRLRLQINYRTSQMFGPSKAGGRSFMFMPEPGETYVMTFWTDREMFSANLSKEAGNGELEPVQVVVNQ